MERHLARREPREAEQRRQAAASISSLRIRLTGRWLRHFVSPLLTLRVRLLAGKSPAFESTPDAGDMLVFGANNAYLSTQPVQLFETPEQGLTAFIMFKVRPKRQPSRLRAHYAHHQRRAAS